MKGDELSERFLEFAARVIRLVTALPKNPIARHIGGQLLPSGTAVGSNYEEGRAAESRADFIRKLGIAWKEARESWYWLRLVEKNQFAKARSRAEDSRRIQRDLRNLGKIVTDRETPEGGSPRH